MVLFTLEVLKKSHGSHDKWRYRRSKRFFFEEFLDERPRWMTCVPSYLVKGKAVNGAATFFLTLGFSVSLRFEPSGRQNRTRNSLYTLTVYYDVQMFFLNKLTALLFGYDALCRWCGKPPDLWWKRHNHDALWWRPHGYGPAQCPCQDLRSSPKWSCRCCTTAV